MKLKNSVFEEAKSGEEGDATGSPAAEVTTEEVVEEVKLDLSDILADDLGEEPPAAAEETPAEEPPAAESEGDEPKPGEEAQPETPEPVETTEEQKPQVEETPTPEPEAAKPEPEPEPETPQKSFEELRQDEEARLEKHYSFSEEDARAVALEPEKMLPKLAARVAMDTYENVFRSVVKAIPQLVDNYQQARTAHQEAENAFFGEFPGLKDNATLRPQIESGLTLFRQQNPSATQEQAIAAVGVQVSIANKVPLPQSYLEQLGLSPKTGGEETPETPARTPIPPATPGATGTPPKKAPDNYYTRIAEEDVDE